MTTSQNADRAKVLAEALPYIQRYWGKTIVVKYGGNAMTSPELASAVMADIVLLGLVGVRVVLVHGGGPDINDMLNRLGHEARFVNGLRYTDQETMEVVQSVLCGKVNKNLVASVNAHGGRALGLCGLDGNLLQARKLDRQDGCDYGLVGDIYEVDPSVVNDAIEDGYVPVVASVAVGVDAAPGTVYNVNADTAAARLAAGMGAEKLVLLTDTVGVLENPDDPSSRIPTIAYETVDGYIERGQVTGGMIPKLECCRDAVEAGVARAHIVDGREPHSILLEMLTDDGAGTMVL